MHHSVPTFHLPKKTRKDLEEIGSRTEGKAEIEGQGVVFCWGREGGIADRKAPR